nr:hypothetical protein [uncultured Desulfobacter sp.]
MNITGIQGLNAYTANAQMADTAPVQNNNKEATAATDINKENAQTLQEAFQVEITPQALTLQSQKQQDLAQEEQNQQPTLQNFKDGQMDQSMNQPQVLRGGQVNIIA